MLICHQQVSVAFIKRHYNGRIGRYQSVKQSWKLHFRSCIQDLFSVSCSGVSSDYAQPITGQVTEVTCPEIGQTQPELTLSKIQKMGQISQGRLVTAAGMCLSTDPCDSQTQQLFWWQQVYCIYGQFSTHSRHWSLHWWHLDFEMFFLNENVSY